MQYKKPVQKTEIKKEEKATGEIVRHNNFGRVTVTEWSNEITLQDGSKGTTTSFSISASYKDKEGNYQRTSNYDVNALASLKVAIDRAIMNHLNDKESEQEQN